MEVTVENLSAVKRKIDVALPPEAVRAEIEQAYRGLAQRARIKGFRPGKVPRRILEQYYGEQVRSEVIGRMIQDSYVRALEEQGLDAVDRPEIVAEEVRPEEGLRYSATIEIKPAFEVGGFDDLTVERTTQPVPDDAVDGQLERLRESYAQMARLEDRDTVEQGDLISIAYTGVLDGRALSGASAEDRIIEIGSNTFPPPFEDQLVGKRVGESTHIDIPYPANHHSKEIAGKTVTFRVEVKAVGRKDLPALDDDFAKDHGECDSLDELRVKIRDGLERHAARDADERVRAELMKQLVERNPIEVPDALVERRLEGMLREVGAHGMDASGNPELAAKLDELRTELRQRARAAVHSGLLLERLAVQEQLAVGDAEVEARIDAMVHAAPRERERLADLYRSPEARREIRDRLAQEQALEWLVGKAIVREPAAQT
jgi:trigger factor